MKFGIQMSQQNMSGKSGDITGNLAVLQKINLFVCIIKSSQIGNAIGGSQFTENFIISTADRGPGEVV